jgi:hypothetical protein
MHEEDQSEPTVATLSSEATGEMDVSSLDDKSQTETHVEKKAQPKCAGSAYFSGNQLSDNMHKMDAKETLRNVKLYKQMKKSTYYSPNKRKTMSDFYARAATPPASFKPQKVLSRRNSWPPVLPLKLTKRKKYHEVIRVKDFQEPFWIDTFDWLTMKCAPEKFKIVPLARLSELDEFDAQYNKNIPNSNTKSRKERISSNIPISFTSTKLSFYCVLNTKQKHIIEKKKYLQNLKAKCFVDSVRSLKPTNFDSVVADDNAVNNNELENRVEKEQIFAIPCAMQESSINMEQSILAERVSYYEVDEDSVEDQENILQQTHRSFFSPINRPVRPLQSYNSESHGSVLISNVTPNFENHSLKQKVFVKDHFRNKENIKVNNYGFPNAKYPDHIEKLKKHSIGPSQKKNQKIFSTSEPMRNKYNLPERFIVNDSNNIGKEINVIPKEVPNKSNKQDLISSAPQDMMEPSLSDSKKSDTSEAKGSSATSSSVSQRSDVSSNNQSSASSSNNGQNKPYLRQLFEQDIQSNFSLSSKVTKVEKDDKQKSERENIEKNKLPEKDRSSEEKTEKITEDKEEPKKSEIPASVIGQAFLSTLIEQVKTPSPAPCIPAAVIGQSFLKTLEEQTAQAKDKPIPAEVIGQSFIKNLLSNQTLSEPTIDSSKVGNVESVLKAEAQKSTEKVLPASVVSQSFLKSLAENQSNVLFGESGSSQISVQPPPVPAAVVGQEFLKTLMQDVVQLEDKPEEPKVVPSSVVSQSFLKSLIEQKTTEQETEHKGVIPSTAVGQAFLKSLIETQIPVSEESDAPKTIPASVIEQTFVKSLLEQSVMDTKESGSPVIPAPVVEQTFLKSLLQAQTTESTESKTDTPIPSSVLAQSFLKSLITQPETESQSPLPTTTGDHLQENISGSNVLPASAVSQAFLKTLIQDQASQDAPGQHIPAPVIAQSFLKSLVSETPEIPGKESAVPSSVIGQTFLKTLLQEQQQQVSEQSEDKPIPSSVVSQAFLKTLLGQTSPPPETLEEHVIPSSVVGQTFLKTLLGQTPETIETSKEQAVPSSVVSQAFLKTLLEQTPESKETSKESVIPSSVVGQTFLKTMLDQVPKAQEAPEEPVIPSTVLGQTFLKTLMEQSAVSQETPIETETVIPSSVVSQAFLKNLLCASDPQSSSVSSNVEETKGVKHDAKSDAIPAPVVSQSFLSALLSQSSQPVPKTDPVPASVVGLAFLKTLTEQAKPESELTSHVAGTSEQSDTKSIPASVVGQAFLKTLFSMSEGSKVTESPSDVQSSDNESCETSCKDLEKSNFSEGNGCSNGCSNNSLCEQSFSDEQSIIPPPPEFSGESEESAHSSVARSSSETTCTSKADLPSNIIQELLSCTKVMQSVIDNMKETESVPTEPETSSQTDICTKEKTS